MMELPKGFDELVKLAMKERPSKPKSVEEIWDKFLFIVFMGGKRSEPEINFIIGMLKPFIGMNHVTKTSGEDWRESVENLLNERMKRIKDEETLEMLKELQKELFRISASIKGGGRFFIKNEINPEKLEQLLDTKEKTWEFIENLVKDEDVPNVRYTKIIIWLQSMGFALDFCAPSWQLKKFVNDVFGYYQFYEDDKYFMKKAEEIAEEIKKDIKKSTARDAGAAIFYYIALKNALPMRSPEKKKFSPAMLIKFLKAKKLTLKDISGRLADFEKRDELMESLYKFIQK